MREQIPPTDPIRFATNVAVDLLYIMKNRKHLPFAKKFKYTLHSPWNTLFPKLLVVCQKL
jgi:hypothetical protein